ncbi:MAG: hypothetical protein ACYC5M_04010 [Anaerolineae bacterium]
MPKKRVSPLILLLAFLILVIALLACSLGDLLQSITSQSGAQPAEPAATLWPTITPTPATARTATVAPVAIATPQATITSADDTEVTIVITEDEVRDALFGNSLAAQGITLTDTQVVFGSGEATASFLATQENTGLKAGVTLRAVPVVADGVAYLRVEEVILDDSVKGFTRMIAQAAVETAIKQSSGEHGFPLRVSGVQVSEVKIEPGTMTIVGSRR